MEQKILGIVLKSIDFRENDKLVTIFTSEGKKTCILKGCKKPNAKLRFASEPFCLGEYILVTKADRTTAINCTLVDLFYDIRTDIKKMYTAFTILEFLNSAVEENTDQTEMFSLAIECIKNICYKKNVEQTTLIYFLAKALEMEGYGLNLDTCTACDKELTGTLKINFDDGGFCHAKCSVESGNTIETSLVNKLKAISNSKKEKQTAFSITDDEIKKIIKILANYIAYHYDIKLNSIKML